MFIFICKIILILILLFVIYLLFRFYKSKSINKRFDPYVIDLLNDDEDSLFESIYYYFDSVRSKFTRYISRSKALRDYSKKYEKYNYGNRHINNMIYISNKIFIGLLCTFLLIITSIFKYENIGLLTVLFAFLAGFFILDIFLYFSYKYREKVLERDMSKAITIMNNAFKSGLSIIQAVELVYTELDGPISDEFKKIHMDISFGLDMVDVFKRFSNRVNSVESIYIASTLSILNKTGGNIVEVFSSVERNTMTRKKLKEELKSVSAQSRAMFGILVCIPIILVLLLLVLNPAFFSPLFTNSLGICILILMILIYSLYIYIIRKIVYIEVRL